MATSPAPDAAAPPGMCPGIAVLGGGGGGGDGDGDGSGGKDGAGGDGNGDGNGANGDGKGSDSCGPGGASCPNNHGGSSVTRGDPVDVTTGRAFTLPARDLSLPGPLPLDIARSYSTSACDRDVGMGHGWTHSLAWEIEEHRRHVDVWNDRGMRIQFDLSSGDEALAGDGWILRRDPRGAGFLLDTDDGLFRWFGESAADGKRYRLSEVRDENGNRITLSYERGVLAEIQDSVGRKVRVESTPEGRTAAIAVKNATAQGRWVTFAGYTYDENGDLTAVTDADGHTTRYGYRDHRLVFHRDPTGLTFHFVYDAAGRCVETWGDYGEKPDPSLAEGVPKVLADRVTRAKGIFHCVFEYHRDGYSEVVDSVKAQRFFASGIGKLDKAVTGGGVFTRTFDERGHARSITDAMGATTTWERDRRGNVLKTIDPLGRETTYERDPNGRVVAVIDPAGEVTRYERDPNGNILARIDAEGAVLGFRYDGRGLAAEATLPNGGRTAWERDAHGNPTRITEPNGAVQRATYDAFGRLTSRTDPFGATIRYEHSPRGDLQAVHHANGGVTRYEYDGAGHVVRQTDADGRAHEFVWGGYHRVCEVRTGGDQTVRLRYDREGNLVEVHNALGEVHRLTYDPAGKVVREDTFDGRVVRFTYDHSGRIVAYHNGAGEVTGYGYDLVGNLVERVLPDESVETFEHDVRGHLVGVKNAHSEVRFRRDRVGRVVQETQRFDGVEHAIDCAFDLLGKRVRRSTSLGHHEEMVRDVMGFRREHLLDGGARRVLIEPDAIGREVVRELPGGARLESRFDVMGDLARRRVVIGSSAPRPKPGEPDFVAGQPGLEVTADHTYRYSLTGVVIEDQHDRRGRTGYERDMLGRLLAVVPEGARGQLFAYDAAGRLRDANGEERIYGPGGRLLRRGPFELLWDDDGRLVEKRRRDPGGRDEVWRYVWNAAGHLERVVAPDGSVSRYAYDPLARRLHKQVSRADGGLSRSVRFVWDGDVLVHEIRRTASAAGDPIVEERTYCFDEVGFVPELHRDVRAEGDTRIEGPWFQYMVDAVGAPDRLIAEDGSVALDVTRSAYGTAQSSQGAITDTPLGFQGQYADEETGLAYNFYRYYDPEAGRYVSPDRLGIAGGLELFQYAYADPTLFADPRGLVACKVNANEPKPGKDRTRAIVQGRDPAGNTYQVTGYSGENHPAHEGAVTTALGTPVAGSKDEQHGHCAEPIAISEYMRQVRANNPNMTDKQILGTIQSIQVREKDAKGGYTKYKKPCLNCGPMLNNLGDVRGSDLRTC